MSGRITNASRCVFSISSPYIHAFKCFEVDFDVEDDSMINTTD